MKLERSFFDRDTVTVAKELLGKFLVTDLEEGRVVGKIIETEAYMGTDDLACHASKGLTKRTEGLFGEVGHLYVYLNYGIFWLTNVVAHTKNGVGGILIRSVEIIEGQSIISDRINDNKFVKLNEKLATGPGKLSVAFGITGDFHTTDFIKSDNIYIEDNKEEVSEKDIICTTRIGVDYAQHCKEYPWRFYIKNNQFISKK
ncbi:MAG: DNA-3-methyladenine glycosylase [Patescibacteria group bacterium]